MTDHDKRASERVPVALRIRLRYQAVDQFISKFAVNISRGGMFLSSRNPKAPGTRIYFEILLADDSPVIEGNGEVRWIREYDRRRPDQPYGMGIRFVGLSEASWALLERILVHRRATGEYNDDEIPEPRHLWTRRDTRAPLVDDGRRDESGEDDEDDDKLASRLPTVVQAERDGQAGDLDDRAEADGEVDGPGGFAAPAAPRGRDGWQRRDDGHGRSSGREPGRGPRDYREPPTRRDEIREARDDAAHRAALDDTAPREDFGDAERRGAEDAARRAGLDDTAPREDLVHAARRAGLDDTAPREDLVHAAGRLRHDARRLRHDTGNGGSDRTALDDAAARPDDDALDTAVHRIDLAGPADAAAADHAANHPAADRAADRGSDHAANRPANETAHRGADHVAHPADRAANRARGTDPAGRAVDEDDPDVIASVARPTGQSAPTNGARAERGDDSPDDRLRRELMRALGPSVLMSQSEAPPEPEPGRPPSPASEAGRSPEREPERPPDRESERPADREAERPADHEAGRPAGREPERPPQRRRTAPPTEPVVRAAMRRARALTSGGAGELDRELAELLEHSAVPVEISVEAASRELAERLGGAAVQPRRAAPAPAAAARSPGPAPVDLADDAALDDEPAPTATRRVRPIDGELSAVDSHAARLLRGK